MRKSDAFLLMQGLLLSSFALTLLDDGFATTDADKRIARNAALVASLDLTDLGLFTEARYTRHPSQADLHSAFQDHPLGLDHFPSGSLVPPPAALSRSREPVAQTKLSY